MNSTRDFRKPTSKNDYNHDDIWTERTKANHGIWGNMSVKVYDRINAIIEEHFPEARTVLDVGCGAGAFGRRCLPRLSYCGVDESAVAIELGKKKHPELELHHGDFVLSSHGSPFDLVVSINVLHCLSRDEDRNQFLANLKNYATQGIILTTMCAPIRENAPTSRFSRAFKTAETIKEEFAAQHLTTLVVEDLKSCDEQNPVSNLTLACILEPSNGSDTSS